MIECSRWWVGGPTALFGHTLSTNAVGGGQGSKKGSKSAVIMYCLNAVGRGSKKAQKLRSSLKYPPLGKWQKGYEVHEGDSVTKGEGGFQGEVGIHIYGSERCWLDSQPAIALCRTRNPKANKFESMSS